MHVQVYTNERLLESLRIWPWYCITKSEKWCLYYLQTNVKVL